MKVVITTNCDNDHFSEEINVSGRTMHMGLDTDLTPFPSFHLRLANFTPGLERVLTAIHLKFSHGREGWESVEGMHAPLLPVLVHLMLHFIDEWQVFALLSHLLVRTAWLDRNKAECHASHLTLISFLRSHAVCSYKLPRKSGSPNDGFCAITTACYTGRTEKSCT